MGSRKDVNAGTADAGMGAGREQRDLPYQVRFYVWTSPGGFQDMIDTRHDQNSDDTHTKLSHEMIYRHIDYAVSFSDSNVCVSCKVR
jgi:hypothetical protein